MKEEKENTSFKYQDKSDFVIKILDYSIRHKVDDKTKERLINLIGKEISKSGSIGDEIIERIEKLEKETNIKTELKKKNKQQNQKTIKHTPTETVKCLRKFKYNNDTGFKQLVHKPSQDNYFLDDYNNTIKRAYEHFNKLNNLPYGLYKNIKELLELMQNEGRSCFEKTGAHPYQNKGCEKVKNVKERYENLYYNFNSDRITNLLQGFKKNYRFDTEKSESSQLKELVINVFNTQSFEKDNVRYEFDSKFDKKDNEKLILLKTIFEEDFENRAVFFTWVPYVRSFLKGIADDILKHGNINENQNYKSFEKELIFSIDRFTDDIEGNTKISFTVFDINSIVSKPKELFYKQIYEKKKNLISLCDWQIEADFRETSYQIQILPATNEPFKKLNDKVGGLKHILTFYEL